MPIRLGILLFVTGVSLLQWQAELPGTYEALVLPLLLTACVLCWRNQTTILQTVSRILFLLLLFGAGYFWAAAMAHWRLADTLPKAWEGKDIQVVGVISSLPQYSSNSVRFQFEVEQILTPDAHVPKRLSLAWYLERKQNEMRNSLPVVHAGERWRITVRLKRPHSHANPHGFDYEAWALERDIRAVGYVRSALDNSLLTVRVNKPAYRIEAWRQQIQQRFDSILDGQRYAGILMTLATGDQRAIPTDQWQVFTRTGTNHLMAISGLHITLVASMVYFLVSRMWRQSVRLLSYLPAHRAAVAAGLIAACIYALLSGFAIPAQRAFFMLAVMAAVIWCGRMAAPTMVLAWALLLVVVIDPWAVLSAGFWLSFGAISIIMLVTTGRIGTAHWLVSWVRVQWAITLGLVPLLLALFQQVSMVSPVANAVAIPLVSLCVVPLTLLSILPPFEFMLPLAHGILSIVMVFLQGLNELSQPVWQQHVPPLWSIAVAVLGIIWLLLPGSLGLNFFTGFPGRWLGVVALLPLFLVLPSRPPEGALWLTVLDVGQGLAVVAQTQHRTLLFDSGPSYAVSDSGDRIVIPFLRAQGIGILDRMIISHADSDHSGGALSVLNTLDVKMLYSSMDINHPVSQAANRSALCVRGESWNWDGVTFEILYPDHAIYADPARKTNESSCVLKITTATGSILIPADIGRAAERKLIDANDGKLPSTVLIAPHHGSLTSSSVAFVNQVNPAVTIFTVGYRNRFGHPRDDILERYRAQGSIQLRSDWHGAILIRFEHKGFFIGSWRQLRPRYWQQKF
ncbi:competence protein ComEC [Nitrosomonas marina]|uniref:Competence protein ComEC n=1 Tax=Nitrosomonas marina TaxID=917 RepID=A0A1H9Z461_9PROT|nr:DNA internalization-related competence protein ComEC/Rec2 [Nitrosomonas marina]SES76283.1 competence protein ComEC [Nitrosomonas marina]